MCGLIGIVHKEGNVCEKIHKGLEYLQYRGYDSCGISVMEDGEFYANKQIGPISGLKKNCHSGKIGIGHTRWATHGCISIKNTHPFMHKNLAIVHNGIIENHSEIRDKYPDYHWKTGCDTESILKSTYEHLKEYRNINDEITDHADWNYAFEKMSEELDGSFAVAFMDLSYPDTLFFIRKGLSPLSIAVSDDFGAIASDCLALSDMSDHVIDIENGQYGYVKAGKYEIKPGNINEKRHIIKSPKMSEKSHDTWFAHEFHTQPMVLSNALHKFNSAFTLSDFEKPKFIDILGCGSSYYAGCVGKYWIEKYANIMCRVQMSSEWKDLKGYDRTIALISQSGETADTLAAFGKQLGAHKTVGFVNTLGSSLSRAVDHVVPTFVGQEVSVASTKAMTGQMLSLFLWATKLSGVNKQDELTELFEKMSCLINKLPENTKEVIDICANVDDLFILAKGNLVPIAYEGALKIKELAYVHAEAMSASELKHGPLAMINPDSSQAIIFLAPSSSSLWSKMLSAVEEVHSRGGKVIVISDKPEKFNVNYSVKMPYIEEDLAPFLYILSMQWIAYGLAIRKGNAIDMPRNLAKSVTVE
ncbi:glutamine--fructose-6-phosphate transaminase (isomerizing) [Candidatus Cytomitobacter indipagum]|uniref:Glutamine--fructose-6-phosphate aminotransferase [isomerizing] n=1 Tax=Candidatus Cytomitobacter indipagum TaxID=2601575 RepID=A0A5C0UEW4_9PROT|nr:glutamine--fructose-6-phosphate transaminase (isomerizing) [Candidatus Cytomitobacter indipagum]QEK37812.1 glutamine--fructose-6-phosphate transaminase (isomerizing) [Candidatus Cytomitobacter indipagum]